MEISLKRMAYVHHKGPFYKPHHTHELWELAYYVRGHGTLAEGEKQYRYGKGTIHLVQAGIPHDENNEEESNIILLYFEMPADAATSGIYTDHNGEVLSLLKRLRAEMQENLAYKQEMADCITRQILLTLKINVPVIVHHGIPKIHILIWLCGFWDGRPGWICHDHMTSG